MKFGNFWYVVAQSNQLKSKTVLSRIVLNEWLAIFRDQDGQPVALRDRCMHRNSRLSAGRVFNGQLHCPYHGWGYDKTGTVVTVPSEGEQRTRFLNCRTHCYETLEREGYIYVRLTSPISNISKTSSSSPALSSLQPFSMPHYQEPGWVTIRVINRFQNTVTHCAENFIDIPHTTFVHPGVFRNAQKKQLTMTIERRDGSVFIEYHNETTNLGWFSRFLNRDRSEIQHIDSFHMPNVTCVAYKMGPHRQLFITSQSIPETETSTLVYTDVTYNYGVWSLFARPLVWWTTQHIIQQDLKVLAMQNDVIQRYGMEFSNTRADMIHVFVESIHECLDKGIDPRLLPNKVVSTQFWV